MMSSMNGARWWKLALPIALFVSLVAGCGGQSPGAGTTAAPMRAAAPAQWRRVNPPPGASKLASLAVSPVNGADAWDCESVDPYTYLIWATTDAGAHWRQVGTLVASHEANATPPVYCRLYTDQANPQVLAADFLYLPRPPDPTIPAGYDLSYLSQDGGATWRPVPGKTQIEALTTSGPSLYALVDDTSVAAFMPHLVVSADSLQTWQTLPLPAASANGASTSGKVNRLYGARGADGVIVSADGLPLEHLNASARAWTPIHLPPLTTRENEGLQMPITWLPTQHTWMICIGALNFATIPPRTGLLRCTTDDGASWRDRPFPTDASGAPLQAANCDWACVPSALTNDGALLAWCETTAAHLTPDAPPIPPAKPGHLLRLALSSTQWVDLGPLGGGNIGISAKGQVVWNAGDYDTAWVADLSGLPTQ